MLYVKGTAFWVYMLYMHVCMPYAYLNMLFANSQCGVHMLSVCVCVGGGLVLYIFSHLNVNLAILRLCPVRAWHTPLTCLVDT